MSSLQRRKYRPASALQVLQRLMHNNNENTHRIDHLAPYNLSTFGENVFDKLFCATPIQVPHITEEEDNRKNLSTTACNFLKL